jgi:Holliday junction DNA helicase RuvA
VHTHVREDQFSLFGFATQADRTAFRTLLGVSSVGPKIALSILSAMPGDELARVIARKEIARLTAVSGVGKKTAERLLLELRDKLPLSSDASAPRSIAAGEPPARDARALLIGALTSMGYKPSEAERAADQLGEAVSDAPLADSIREALRFLAKK